MTGVEFVQSMAGEVVQFLAALAVIHVGIDVIRELVR